MAKNKAAQALGKLRAKSKKAPSMAEIGSMGGKKRAKPTKCARCGALLPTARQAWMHCRKPRAKKIAVGKGPRK